MVFEGSDHEPDEPEEYDPEAEFRDPDSDSLTIPDVTPESESESEWDPAQLPTVSPPEVATPETDVPPELAKTFWALVLVVNAAVFALALGILFLLFEGNTTYAAWLIGGGIVLVAFAIRRYLTFDSDSLESEPTDGNDEANAESEAEVDADGHDSTTESTPAENPDDTDP
ncbi:DUF7322 domain-containing protein [Natronobacterium texcoconense]|uniref:DUF7322 domain-containing protein n=1 Tax=Natronobacterium texcoconense TaxID=1095778 RepID=A0A1H1AT09_NATTX|nr:hypothetical protein [Natronobacterium texcoconense]SDQ42789.1 hypothetical protein SAMN04489842_0802 [Natronobacterium texcoconense]